MRVSLILAMAENRVIGRDGDLPWRLPADLKRFKALTLDHAIVMGRRTWESIGRPLPRRRSIVLTRDPTYQAEGAETAASLDEALELAAGDDEVFVIGGASVYAEALPRAGRVYLTRVHAEVEGDVRCPPLADESWELAGRERHQADDKHAHAFTFEVWERRDVLLCGDVDSGALHALLDRYRLELRWVADGEDVPGSHWGAPEAGLVGTAVYVRRDTPVHSLLHEACHAICMDGERRRRLDTDAGGDDDEESAVCYLQIVLADELAGVGAERLAADMDRWGYSFRLGSTRAWFEGDAEDSRQWLARHRLIDGEGRPSWRLRP